MEVDLGEIFEDVWSSRTDGFTHDQKERPTRRSNPENISRIGTRE